MSNNPDLDQILTKFAQDVLSPTTMEAIANGEVFDSLDRAKTAILALIRAEKIAELEDLYENFPHNLVTAYDALGNRINKLKGGE